MTRVALAAAFAFAAVVGLATAAGAQIEPPTTSPPPPTVPTTQAPTPTTAPVGGVVSTTPKPTPPTTTVRRTTTSSSLPPSTTLFTVPTPEANPASGGAPSAAPRTGSGEISGFYALLSVFGFATVAALLAAQWFLTRPGRRGRTL